MEMKTVEKGETKAVETKDAPGLGLRGSSMTEDLESIRSLDTKSDTSTSFLPDLSLTEEDHKALMKDAASGPIYTDRSGGDVPEPMDFKKWQYNRWLLNNNDDLDCELPDSPEKSDGASDRKREPVKDDPAKASESKPEAAEAVEAKKTGDKIYLDHDVELDVDEDGKVKKLTYTDHNGKKRTLTEDQWNNVKGEKKFSNGILVARDWKGETTILLPNGKVVHLNSKGRFMLFTDTTE